MRSFLIVHSRILQILAAKTKIPTAENGKRTRKSDSSTSVNSELQRRNEIAVGNFGAMKPRRSQRRSANCR